jgi:RHS repeat-associated protein
MWLHDDHLGSASLATDETGATVGELRYTPWGEERAGFAGLPTDRTFTGQRREPFGLLDYNARYYDPRLGRFLSADAVAPDPLDPQTLNGYAYALNAPTNYTDPSGHWVESALDIISIGYDLYDISQNGLNWENGLSLAADVVGLALPVVTGGGLAVRAGFKFAARADDITDAAKFINKLDDVAGEAKAIVSAGVDKAKSALKSDGFKSLVRNLEEGSVSFGSGKKIPTDVAGPFSLTDQARQTIPEGARPPKDWVYEFRTGMDQELARKQANNWNTAFKRSHGLQNQDAALHELKPVKWGGSPTDPANKVVMDRSLHETVTSAWRRLQAIITGR